MNDLQIFNNPEFGEIRTVTEDGRTLFCGSDIAKALGYARPNEAIAAHSKGTVKRRTPTSGGMQEMSFIPEGDVYRLVVRSQLPSAERFEQWVFNEVLPSIRQHGAYLTPQKIEEVLTNPDTIIELATRLKRSQEIARQQAVKIEADKPKVLFAKSVEASDDCILVGVLAKLLRQNGIPMGQNRMFDWLRDNGFLIKSGTSKNMPTQLGMERGLFMVRERTIGNPDGSVRTTRTPMVTGRGQTYFINRLLTEFGEEAAM